MAQLTFDFDLDKAYQRTELEKLFVALQNLSSVYGEPFRLYGLHPVRDYFVGREPLHHRMGGLIISATVEKGKWLNPSAVEEINTHLGLFYWLDPISFANPYFTRFYRGFFILRSDATPSEWEFPYPENGVWKPALGCWKTPEGIDTRFSHIQPDPEWMDGGRGDGFVIWYPNGGNRPKVYRPLIRVYHHNTEDIAEEAILEGLQAMVANEEDAVLVLDDGWLFPFTPNHSDPVPYSVAAILDHFFPQVADK